MSKSICLVATCLALFAVQLSAEEPKPKSPPPRPVLANVQGFDWERNTLQLSEVLTITRVANERVQGNLGGQVAFASKSIYQISGDEVIRTIPLPTTEAFDSTGRKLSREEFRKRLTVGAAVLVSVDDKPVAPRYLKALSKDTVVLVTDGYFSGLEEALEAREADAVSK